ncbi:hypothetical protein EV715DRAFT_206373 [Schizophyllum commune]
MPELTEYCTDKKKLNNFAENEPESHRRVKSLWHDRTRTESDNAPAGSPGRRGLVEELRSSSAVTRGQRDNQTPLYPTPYATKGEDVPISTHGLVFMRAYSTPRSLCLHFEAADGKPLWAEVQYYQHTNSQEGPLSSGKGACISVRFRLNLTLAQSGLEGRGFRVSLAFVLEHHVIAFNSLDNITQFHWARSREELPHKYLDVLAPGNLWQLEENVREWVLSRRLSGRARTDAAVDRMRLAVTKDGAPLFPGMGVYTTSEVWHAAGLPPNITEEELCDGDDGGRLGRLIASYYSFAQNAEKDAWSFIRPYIKNYLLAVSQEERRDYEKKVLRVYGRDTSCTTHRYGRAADDAQRFWRDAGEAYKDMIPPDIVAAWVRAPGGCPKDPFEPNDVRHALMLNDAANPGSVIFGVERWRTLAAGAGVSLSSECISGDNPIAWLFRDPTQVEWLRSHGQDPTVNRLNPDLYDELFTPDRNNQRRIPTHVYDFACDIWSCIPPYPHLSQPPCEAGELQVRTEKRRDTVAMAYSAALSAKERHDVDRARAAVQSPSSAGHGARRGNQAVMAMLPHLPDDGTSWRTFYDDPLLPPKGKGRLFSCKEREVRLIKYNVAHHVKKYTVGPLDFCGVARKVKCGSVFVTFVCERDPRHPTFLQRRRLFSIATARLSAKGNKKEGLPASEVRLIAAQVPVVPSKRKLDKENEAGSEVDTQPKKKKLRASADRLLAGADISLSPRRTRHKSTVT